MGDSYVGRSTSGRQYVDLPAKTWGDWCYQEARPLALCFSITTRFPWS
jgi:hypothetical protein